MKHLKWGLAAIVLLAGVAALAVYLRPHPQPTPSAIHGTPANSTLERFQALHRQIDGIVSEAIKANGYTNKTAAQIATEVNRLGGGLHAEVKPDGDVEILTPGSPVPRVVSMKEPQR